MYIRCSDSNTSVQLVPIDNGLCLPGLDALSMDLSNGFAWMSYPQARPLPLPSRTLSNLVVLAKHAYIFCLILEHVVGSSFVAQAKRPFSDDVRRYVARLDGRKDAQLLRSKLDHNKGGGTPLRQSSLLTLRVCTTLLKETVSRGE